MKQRLVPTQVKNAKPADKQYKLTDGGGMYLLVRPDGAKYWRYDYRFQGRRKTLALGVFPEVTLAAARQSRNEARDLLVRGQDPAEERRAQKSAPDGSDSFEAVAREWFARQEHGWASNHSTKIIRRLERDIFPWIGDRRIGDIRAPEVLRTLRRIEQRGAIETAHRAKQNCGQVFRYAIATGRADRDPSADLRGALPPSIPKSFASVKDPAAVGALLRAIDGYEGSFITRCALQLAPMLFVRPGELRHAQWPDFDLDGAEWRIPAERMKSRQPHIVPLADQALTVLQELQPLTQRGRYLFPGVRSASRPMSENTVNAALRRMGYSSQEMTGHGFRSMASTLLNEQGWNRDAIERQLAHAERDTVRAAYNYAEYLVERRKMMQAWADYLDSLKRGADVVPIRGSSAS